MQQGGSSQIYYIKSGNSKRNTMIYGYASVFGTPDTDNDIVAKGAFKNTNYDRVKLLWQHDMASPIGKINLLEEDEYGLKIEAEINNATNLGLQASELVKQRAVDGLSIGFKVKSFEFNPEGFRVITDIDLMEVSIVTFPANQNAQINCIKNQKFEQEAINFELAEIERLSKLLII